MRTTIGDVRVMGMASALPADITPMSERVAFLGEKRIKRTMQGTGVENVRIAAPGTTASDLCVHASEHLFSALNIDGSSVDAIVFVTMSPDFKAPPTSAIMQDRLKVPIDAVAFDINYGCSAFIYGLYQSAMLLRGGGCGRVLLCLGDTTSKFINPKDGALCALGGDAGTAVLLERGSSSMDFIIKTDGSGYDNLIIPGGGARFPFAPENCREETDESGNVRTRNDLYMNGMEIMKFALREVPILVEELLSLSGWKREDVGVYAFHQPNRLILEYLRDALGADEKSLPVVLENTGNTGAASIPLLLTLEHDRLRREGRLSKVLACGFGVGLSWGGVTLDLTQARICDPIFYPSSQSETNGAIQR